jgi:hypothetical protein
VPNANSSPNNAHASPHASGGDGGGGDFDFEIKLKKYDDKFAALKKNVDDYDDLGVFFLLCYSYPFFFSFGMLSSNS